MIREDETAPPATERGVGGRVDGVARLLQGGDRDVLLVEDRRREGARLLALRGGRAEPRLVVPAARRGGGWGDGLPVHGRGSRQHRRQARLLLARWPARFEHRPRFHLYR